MPMYYPQFLTAGFWDALVDKLQEANGLNPAPLPAELKAEAVARVWYNVKCVLLVVFLVVAASVAAPWLQSWASGETSVAVLFFPRFPHFGFQALLFYQSLNQCVVQSKNIRIAIYSVFYN